MGSGIGGCLKKSADDHNDDSAFDRSATPKAFAYKGSNNRADKAPH
jgi:hypothetical protein